MPACGSPKLIAACHVLLRLLLPRHPPCALSSLTTKFTRHTAARLNRLTLSSRAEHQFRKAKLMRSRGTLCWLLTLATLRRLNLMGLESCSSRARRSHVPHPSRVTSGTHKNLQRLVFCPIYSVVKYRPRQLTLTYPLMQVWVLLTSECANSSVPPTQCSAPIDFHEP
jgi:hypothetical protein